jgi:SAM-dependent methyltransferase
MRAHSAVLLSALCTGCSNWTGFGFHAEGGELPRLREALVLKADAVTEIDPDRLRRLREAKVANVTVVEAQASETGLPPNCCDAIVLRRVYHHLAQPAPVNASLLRALRPGGALAVIDFAPPFFLGRGAFGVPVKAVIDEVTGSGFELVRVADDWPGRGPLASYLVLFRKP